MDHKQNDMTPHAAAEALRWLSEMGADEIIGETPVDRMTAPAAKPAPAAARAAPAPAAAPVVVVPGHVRCHTSCQLAVPAVVMKMMQRLSRSRTSTTTMAR